MNDLVYFDDLNAWIEDIEASQQYAPDIAQQVLGMMGEEVATLARAYAPHQTGELVSSIRVVHGEREVKVVADAPHAAFVEFGTWSHNVLDPKPGTYEIRPRNAKSLRFIGADGREVHTQVVRHPGIKPQPYLGRANDEVLQKYLGIMGNAGVVLLVA